MTGLVNTLILNKGYFCPASDSSDSDSYSDSDSDGDNYSGWLWFNLWSGFVMAQNDRAGDYINFK